MDEKETKQYRLELEESFGEVWNTEEATDKFVFDNFAWGFAFVTRREDDAKGSLDFTHMPRFYHSFKEK